MKLARDVNEKILIKH